MTDASPNTLALIAHDGKKDDMLAFVQQYKTHLGAYDLVATNTTGTLIERETGLAVQKMLSGPHGGDAQIAAMIAEHRITAVFFFVDPLGKHPHDPDIQGLLRICNVHNIPVATNPATARHIIGAI